MNRPEPDSFQLCTAEVGQHRIRVPIPKGGMGKQKGVTGPKCKTKKNLKTHLPLCVSPGYAGARAGRPSPQAAPPPLWLVLKNYLSEHSHLLAHSPHSHGEWCWKPCGWHEPGLDSRGVLATRPNGCPAPQLCRVQTAWSLMPAALTGAACQAGLCLGPQAAPNGLWNPGVGSHAPQVLCSVHLQN